MLKMKGCAELGHGTSELRFKHLGQSAVSMSEFNLDKDGKSVRAEHTRLCRWSW